MSGPRVAILGGGMAGLTTAWAVTEQNPGAEVTVYQMGWRLGGKCAASRGAVPGCIDGRIEEHGIHLLGGGYFNALPMMRRIYDALEKSPAGWPTRFAQAIDPQWVSVSVDRKGAAVSAQEFPDVPMSPREWSRLDTPSGLIRRVFVVALALFKDRFSNQPGLASAQESYLSALEGHIEQAIRLLDAGEAERAVQEVERFELFLADVMAMPETKASAQAGLKAVLFADMGSLRYFVAILRGALVDVVLKGATFSSLDRKPYQEWLVTHGLRKADLGNDIVLSPIRILYQWPHGKQDAGGGSMGAGAYLHWVLRTFAYDKAPFWFFQDGTGESLVLPIYSLLKRRGVKFAFFHRVDRIDVAGGGIEVDIDVQALTKGSAEYEPLVRLSTGKLAWPAEPKYELLDESPWGANRPDAEAFEAYYPRPMPAVKREKLRQGTDFDMAVLAISIGALPLICSEAIRALKGWQPMLERIATVETQSLQLWMSKDTGQLGFDLGAVLKKNPRDPNDSALGCGWQEPFDGFADFSGLIRKENWNAGGPGSLWYFSDVLEEGAESPDDPGYVKARHLEAARQCGAFMDNHLRELLPGVDAGGGFDDSLLVPPAKPGGDRLDSQWVRANVQPSERYVQALHGTTAWRLAPWESGLPHLVLAGDWTYNGLNVGCVEAAVMSGLLAANAVLGKPGSTEGVVAYFPP